MGVCSDASHTDVHAAEAARKQAVTLLLLHLVLFFFLFVLFIFFLTLPLFCLPVVVCLSFFFIHSFFMLAILSLPPHSDDYSKGLKGTLNRASH